ncbi:hypothetical protein IJ182_03480 [bacterium]|nr:hypothetical protein [bacterium]
MKINNIQSFCNNNINKFNNQKQIYFKGKADIVDFSSVAKSTIAIINNLKNIGFSDTEAANLVKDYYNTDEYYKLVNGEYDEEENKTYPCHWIDFDRNLNPEEAIVYQAYDMKDYYMQYMGCYPEGHEKSTFDSQKYDIGEAKFSPILLAKEMIKGNDICMSSMILKGNIDEETAQEVNKYYSKIHDRFSKIKNVQAAEYTIDLLNQNLDKLRYYTSDERKEDGTLINGYTRALTDEEAAILVTCDYLPTDSDSINNYIEMNKKFGCTLFTMDLRNLWGKKPEDLEQKPNVSNVTQLRVPRHFETLQERIEAVMEKDNNNEHKEFYEDMMELDNEKFFARIPARTLKYDAMMSFTHDRDLRRKNIQVLNSISEELLEKMAPGKNGKKGCFATLNKLLKTSDLDERVSHLEEYRINSPKLFESLSKESVMDYLTNSTFYSDSKKQLDEFNGICFEAVTGIPYEEPKPAEILPIKIDE